MPKTWPRSWFVTALLAGHQGLVNPLGFVKSLIAKVPTKAAKAPENLTQPFQNILDLLSMPIQIK
jgi:hypothetical protein